MLKSLSKDKPTLIRGLSDEVIEKLIEDHWREIKGLMKEQKRRKKIVLNTDKPTLGA